MPSHEERAPGDDDDNVGYGEETAALVRNSFFINIVLQARPSGLDPKIELLCLRHAFLNSMCRLSLTLLGCIPCPRCKPVELPCTM